MVEVAHTVTCALWKDLLSSAAFQMTSPLTGTLLECFQSQIGQRQISVLAGAPSCVPLVFGHSPGSKLK